MAELTVEELPVFGGITKSDKGPFTSFARKSTLQQSPDGKQIWGLWGAYATQACTAAFGGWIDVAALDGPLQATSENCGSGDTVYQVTHW